MEVYPGRAEMCIVVWVWKLDLFQTWSSPVVCMYIAWDLWGNICGGVPRRTSIPFPGCVFETSFGFSKKGGKRNFQRASLAIVTVVAVLSCAIGFCVAYTYIQHELPTDRRQEERDCENTVVESGRGFCRLLPVSPSKSTNLIITLSRQTYERTQCYE